MILTCIILYFTNEKIIFFDYSNFIYVFSHEPMTNILYEYIF